MLKLCGGIINEIHVDEYMGKGQKMVKSDKKEKFFWKVVDIGARIVYTNEVASKVGEILASDKYNQNWIYL